MTDVEVRMGDVAVAGNPTTLRALGVGSCVVITLYDPQLRIGALAHAMLPSDARRKGHRTRDLRYVDMAIDEMLARMATLGSKREDIEAKLVGGADMFPDFSSDVSKSNVLSAKEQLKKVGIKVVGEAVGGSVGRSVEFSPVSGIVTVKVRF